MSTDEGIPDGLALGSDLLGDGDLDEGLDEAVLADDGRLAAALDWRARYDLRAGFGDTIAWYRRHHWL